jgi:acyl-CoA synthetase (AMP-forming)/AMP-acid ligase II
MFHVNAWGIPYAAALVGAKLVFPGPNLDGRSLYELFESEQVTFSGGVPTIWFGLLRPSRESPASILQLEAHRDWRLSMPTVHDPRVPRAIWG